MHPCTDDVSFVSPNPGFLIYFVYGMKESSEEYRRRGMPPPGPTVEKTGVQMGGARNVGSIADVANRYGTRRAVDDTSGLVENEDYDSSCEH